MADSGSTDYIDVGAKKAAEAMMRYMEAQNETN